MTPITDEARKAAKGLVYPPEFFNATTPERAIQNLLDSTTTELRALLNAEHNHHLARCKQVNELRAQVETLEQKRIASAKLYELAVRNQEDWMRKWDALRMEVETLTKERDEAKKYAERLRGAINGSGPRDVDYMIAMEKEIDSLHAQLATATAEVERLTDAISWSEAKALDDAAELRVKLAAVTAERDEERAHRKEYYDLSMTATKAVDESCSCGRK